MDPVYLLIHSNSTYPINKAYLLNYIIIKLYIACENEYIFLFVRKIELFHSSFITYNSILGRKWNFLKKYFQNLRADVVNFS